MKKEESITQNSVNSLKRQYEKITPNTPLRVQFVGDMCVANMDTVIPALLSEDFQSKPSGHRVVLDCGSGLSVHVARAVRPDWYSVNNRVGFVERNSREIIETAIKKKAKELRRYKDAAGPDIRLLLVADRDANSGKLILEERGVFDFHGFKAVYFLSYPESVVVLENANAV